MDLELKECWFFIIMIMGLSFAVGLGFGQASDKDKENYSLGYAECKGGFEHKYYKAAEKADQYK